MQLRVYLAITLALALITALLWYNFDTQESPDQQQDSARLELPVEPPILQSLPVQPEPDKQALQMIEDIAPEKPELVLPSLNESDPFVRAQAASLTASTLWTDWIARDELIRRFGVIVENASRGELPRRQLGFLAPRGGFKVTKSSGKIYLDSQGYARYDALVEAIMTLPVDPSAQLLGSLQPLIFETLQELGVKEIDGQTLLQAAIDQVLATPVVHGEIELKQPKVFYRFADSELESLSPLQKQIMRMGPSNTLRLQTFVRRLVLSLEGDML